MILVAIKKYQDVYKSKTRAQRTYREIEILSQLQHHENILSLYEVIECSNGKKSDIYLILKYMDSDLERIIKSRSLNKTHIAHILLQILKGVCFMHAKGCFHRDLKSSNILIDSLSNVKIGDFGLCRKYDNVLDDEPREMTDYVVSRWYRAPEILLGKFQKKLYFFSNFFNII